MIYEMKYNYHTHTALSGHATGSMREYVESAIASGITRMGFSDHPPFLRHPNTFWRCPPHLVEGYVEEARALREEYKDRIDISIGFEMEYYPECFDEMLSYVRRLGAEYLLLGEHYISAKEDFYVLHHDANAQEEEMLKRYVFCLTEGMRSGVFSYLAHPDLFAFSGDPDIYRREMRKICRVSRETGVPLEINFLGIRQGRSYPNPLFWELAGEEGASVLFGFDAHDARAAGDVATLPHAMRLVEKYRLNLIEEPSLRLFSAKKL